MGVPCSCPITCYCNIENSLESIVLNSISLQDYEQKTPVWFRAKESQEMVSPLTKSGRIEHCSVFNPNSPKHEAAIKLQKVYKSFRTRRKLADCAVLIEKSWWKFLDFAELKHSSISFFHLQKHETAISRWSRARTRAAKVGKGLSKNSKAQKLALQHWLEAIDPRHRYGHNLHFYYMNWLNSESKEPFFYWLDIGEGKEVNLIENCPRLKLQQQCIKYLGPIERKAYEVAMENGKLYYKQTGELLNTTNEPKGSKWIFVLSTSKTLYVAKKKKGSFQHSSFLAGGATLAAGRIVAENGVLQAVWPHSGHYRPTPENFQDLISFLRENNVDLNDVKLDSTDDEEESVGKTGGVYTRSNSSKDNFTEQDHLEIKENEIEDSGSESSDKGNSGKEETTSPQTPQKPATLQIPSKDESLDRFKSETGTHESSTSSFPPTDRYKHDENIPEESIFRRINLHTRTKSFQLGKQLSCSWSTGAGPRIGCLRDYPSGLQLHALEQVNLSPKSQCRYFSFRALTPNGSSLCRSSSQPVDILGCSSVL